VRTPHSVLHRLCANAQDGIITAHPYEIKGK
jgi:hypothetical protein